MEHAHGLPHNYPISIGPQALPPQAAAGARQSCMCRCAETARPREGQMSICLRRREFIAGLGGAAAWPFAAHAQQQLPVIGFLSSASVSAQATAVPSAFRKGLSQKGFVPGQNVIIETRQAEGHYEMLAALAHELIRIPVKVIVAAGGAVSARVAIEATKTIPVLFIAGFDPVKLGFVSSFNRPGGNATGVSIYTTELLAKRLQLLRELMPRASRIAFLINADNVVSEIEADDVEMIARAAGLR